jgi:hypothetical protein
MRKVTALLFACALSLAATPPASPQVRIDLGGILSKEVDIPSKDSKHRNLDGFLDELPVLPLPEASLRYQMDFGLLKAGAGLRAFSLIAETMAWPEAYAELDLGRASIEARLGGAAFLMFGISNQSAFGRVLVPDLSAWLKLGGAGAFRLGAGAAGLYVPKAFGDPMTVLIYIGGKTSIAF